MGYYKNIIPKATDAGNTWVGKEITANTMFRGISFAGPNTGTAVDTFGKIFRTADGGDT